MNEARRTLRYWILTALLERGADPVLHSRRQQEQPAERVRALSVAECRRLWAPAGCLRFMPSPAARLATPVSSPISDPSPMLAPDRRPAGPAV